MNPEAAHAHPAVKEAEHPAVKEAGHPAGTEAERAGGISACEEASVTVFAAYSKAKGALARAGVPDADHDAKILMEYACGVKRSDLYAHGERILDGREQTLLKNAIEKRASRRVPLAYITGTQGFMGLDFIVREGVLVPRPDTETLVEAAMKHLFDGMRILDLCTGSGCIGLSLLHYSNDTEAVLTDLSDDAVACAEENADRLGLGSRAAVVKCDLFPPAKLVPENGFDIVTANPPYIRTDVIETLEDEVRVHEPRMALDGGADGLAFYRRIAERARTLLARGGYLFAEIGYDQQAGAEKLFAEAGLSHSGTVRDLAGMPRVVFAMKKGNG